MITTGRNDLVGGLDLVVEGEAALVTDEPRLHVLAAAWEERYGPEWHFDVADGAFVQRGNGGVLVYRISPTVGFRFGKAPYSQTRWRF